MAAVVAGARLTTVRDGREILSDVSLAVGEGEHWALLGPNGAGKSTLLKTLGAWQFPTRGRVTLLGKELGRFDIREMRRHIGWVDATFRVRPELTVSDAVLTGASGMSELLRFREIPETERVRARELTELLGVAHLADRTVGTLSAGERGRTLIARALLPDPRLLLLDEPFTGLDLPGREGLRPALATLAAAETSLASVLVTHHLEELPASTTHAALLRDGRLVASGRVEEVLTSGLLSDVFGVPLTVERLRGRWLALGH